MKLLLLSGGMDSALLLFRLVKEFGSKEVIALTINYNQANQGEISNSASLCADQGVKHIVFDFKDFGNKIKHRFRHVAGSSYPSMKCIIPHKNMLFSSLAASIAEVNDCSAIYIGCNDDDRMVWDVSEEYFKTLESLTDGIKFVLPLFNMNKTQIYKELLSYVDPDKATDSCYAGVRCGVCGSCQLYSKAKDAVKKAQQ